MLKALLLGIAAVLPYLPCVYGEPVFDDVVLLTNQELNKAQWRWEKWRWFAFASYTLNRRWFGLFQQSRKSRLGWHLTSIGIHAVNALLGWWAFSVLGISESYLAALIFAVHPLASQSVAYIAGRPSALATLFGLLSIISFRTPWAASLFALLACLSKEDAAFLFPLLSIVGFIYSVPWYGVPVLVGIAGLIGYRRELGQRMSPRGSGNDGVQAIGWPGALPHGAHQLTSFTEHILGLACWAVGTKQSADHQPRSWTFGRLLPALVLFVGACVLAYGNVQAELALLFMLAPASVYLVVPMPDVIAENRLYFSVLGIAMLAALLPAYLAVWLVGMFAICTAARAWYWSNAVNLWASVDRYGFRERALINLGNAWMERKEYVLSRRCYDEALGLNPDLALARANRAIIDWTTGSADKAIDGMRECLRRCPRFHQGHEFLGKVYESVNRFEDAAESYLRAVELAKAHGAMNRLGLIRLRQSNLKEAAYWFERAARSGADTHVYNHAIALNLQGKREESIAAFRRLPREIPINPDMIILQEAKA